jgi:hypothetical protein
MPFKNIFDCAIEKHKKSCLKFLAGDTLKSASELLPPVDVLVYIDRPPKVSASIQTIILIG